ncbi:MAG: HIT domain-containing protein [Anaeroplasmataceae bacterium]|nr:HIT domain-containing protein [Anaeroplasmataceae bacterium]
MKDMYAYYSKENIKAYGALAIYICRLESITPKILVDNGICPTCFNKENHSCLYGDSSDKMLYQDDKIECFLVGAPRAEGHVIISTIKHYKDMLEAPKDIVLYVYGFAHKAMQIIKEVYQCESVYLCTMCDGPMNHFHVQLISRYANEERGSKNFVKPRNVYICDEEKLSKLRKLFEVLI